MISRIGVSRSLRVFAAALCAAVFACKDDPAAPPAPPAPPPVPDRSVAVSYCAAAAPTWVAFRDGDGAWTRAMPNVTGSTTTFRHSFATSRAAMASFTPLFGGELSVLSVLYGSPAELSTQGDTTDADCLTGIFKALRGSVSGLDATQAAFIAIGPSSRTGVVPQFGLDFTLDGVPAGPQDLLASRTAQDAPPRLIVRRDLDLPSGSVIPTLDFASPEAFDMLTANLTIENPGADGHLNLSVLRTPHGEFFLPVPTRASGPTQPYFALPADKLLAGDLAQLEVSSNSPTSVRTADVFFRSPTNRTVTLGNTVEAPTVSVIGGAAPPRPRAAYVPQAEYDRLTSIVYEQPARGEFVVISMTPAYAALAGGYELEVPDLAGVAGFDPSWALRPGFTAWTATRSGGTLPIGRDVKPFDGATRRTGLTGGTITLPSSDQR